MSGTRVTVYDAEARGRQRTILHSDSREQVTVEMGGVLVRVRMGTIGDPEAVNVSIDPNGQEGNAYLALRSVTAHMVQVHVVTGVTSGEA